MTLADVIRAIDGPLAGVGGSRPRRSGSRARGADGDVWIAVRASLRNVLERVTLADVVAGELPDHVREMVADEDAWVRIRVSRMTGRSTAAGVLVAAGVAGGHDLVLYPLEEIAPAGLARRPVPAGRAARVDALGAVARPRHERRRGAGVQLLPHPADRAVHDRRGRELGRAGRVPGRRRVASTCRTWRAPRAARPSGGGARPTWRPSWRSCCSAARSRTRRCTAAKRIADTLEIDSAAVVLERVDGDERQRPCRSASRHAAGAGAAEDVARERIAPALRRCSRRARARGAHARGGRDERAAAQRRDQDRRPALGLARPALAADRDRRRGRGAVSPALDAEDRDELADTIAPREPPARAARRPVDRPRAAGGRRRRAACGLDLARRGDPGRRRGHRRAPERLLARDRSRPPADPGRRRQLRRAVANLIENALRFGDGETVLVRARVSGGRILMRVVDQGPGIPAAEMFRYERPQAGRFRQFHQFGVEVFGSNDPALDAEVIVLGVNYLKELGLENLDIYINSIGCPDCRKEYFKDLQEYFNQYRQELCEDCQSRIDRNPMRVLDCKVDNSKEIISNAPSILDYLCADCQEHFARVKDYLSVLGLDYTIDARMVRGLDYYTNTVFEIKYSGLGAQDTILAGGRYNGLAEEIGGKSIPGIGFAAGMERFITYPGKREGRLTGKFRTGYIPGYNRGRGQKGSN